MDSAANSIAYYRHDPSGIAESMILLIHGLGEHSGRYTEWIKRFNNTGIGIWSFDLPGHGNSSGKRGVMPFFEQVYDIIDDQFRVMREEYPGVSLFIYGHSLGGNIALGYLLNRKPLIDGAVITSPWILLTESPSPFKAAMSSLFLRIMPEMTLSSGLKTDYLSHDKGVVERYKSDPLVHGLISPRLFSEAEKNAAGLLRSADQIKLPLLLVHGRDDMITSPSGTVEVAEKAPNAILKLWDGGYHELHNEPFKEDHYILIREWIDTIG